MDLTRPTAVHVPVVDSSQVGAARRAAMALANATGLGTIRATELGIVVTELGNNLLNHGGGGDLLMQRRGGAGADVIDVVAYDRGPGMADVVRCLADGYSTAGTPGNGLGAVRRLSDEFDVYSRPGAGTIVLARFVLAPSVVPAAVRWGALLQPMSGEIECGDVWAVSATTAVMSFMIADGLGHGPDAAAAARAVADAFLQDASATPQHFLDHANRAAVGTRGAAAAAAQLTLATGRLMFGGIGNIGASLLTGSGSRGMMSYGGIVGVRARSVKMFEHAWPADGLLVMHSDGIRSRWSLDDYPAIANRDPMIVAAALLRDCSRGRDDVSVLVARRMEAAHG